MGKNTIKFKVSGIKEIQRAFRELPDKLAKKVIRQALRKGLVPIRDTAKTDAPRKTGLMAAAIKIRAATKRKRGVISLDVRIGDHNFKGATFYGGFQEFGTKNMEGQHFMENAFRAKAPEAVATIMDLVAKGIEREAKA
ncbi:HK97-gp10 family putative phage morphogenesis protein [Singulisphaera acidiphila]|uniref:Phage protein, HK97 gp10 family n=1 Tax=Singulisphaera acidiphila (strain ATCC BAA-1392 / DSM 18658 / VKM B-2454 / MOB10) TaxID=886293 RepID=L0DJ65_SINAD|nr:HK97-gp10 family putative phage morphogenesis protein [Singulisphaera acidiphila]AGA28721.1 phage protein, HK97 gp10 family [Singulisphaera acidiphila DSM 18658]